MSYGRFVPQHVIDRRMQANDDRYARALRARCPRLAPEVVTFASIEIVPVEDSDPFGPAPTETVFSPFVDTTAGQTKRPAVRCDVRNGLCLSFATHQAVEQHRYRIEGTVFFRVGGCRYINADFPVYFVRL